MPAWVRDAVVYHLYPLGMCGAPARNDFTSPPEARLARLYDWIEHLRGLGMNALYLGPVFESSSHGYDTADYSKVDRRLGTNADLSRLVAAMRAAGIRVILDGVFHHVGRDFWAFRDVQAHGERSRYRDWFSGLQFGRRSPYGDPFSYEGWSGHYNLVKLNLQNAEVRAHLFGVVEQWMSEFGIEGLRLDVAEVMDVSFLRDLAAFCRRLRPDFWLLGEAIHGDYRHLGNPETLDSVTNYECYKGLYSSLNDRNYFEIAYSLQRQFGENGLYRDLPLYNFVDNHDVNRIASTLKEPAHLLPLHLLLFTMPGVPSIYYGSEWGQEGVKQGGDDSPLRPALAWPDALQRAPRPSLMREVARLARIRHRTRALRHGAYQQLLVTHEQFAFLRRFESERVVVALNAADVPAAMRLDTGAPEGSTFVDLLEPDRRFTSRGGRLEIEQIPPRWGRILALS
ncbi:alpha-amylase family glycosyl hydrolase [Cystobacter ferrugineus]|uniref:Alpha-amylase n=1 Tax=Cystobacter ferrugineus TaxID=83449 RepID=A0A1L9BCV7_9BACT|nr:alpha-amylase family glycosyl hydrolase [Cystobacter ferrugineus]OJH40081.1 alpha-amylase [Cystobacter ferrugineus]